MDYFIAGNLGVDLAENSQVVGQIVAFLQPEFKTIVDLEQKSFTDFTNFFNLIPGTERWVEVSTFSSDDFLRGVDAQIEQYNSRQNGARFGFPLKYLLLLTNVELQGTNVLDALARGTEIEDESKLFIFSTTSPRHNEEEMLRLKDNMLRDKTTNDECSAELARVRQFYETRDAEQKQRIEELRRTSFTSSSGSTATATTAALASSSQLYQLNQQLKTANSSNSRLVSEIAQLKKDIESLQSRMSRDYTAAQETQANLSQRNLELEEQLRQTVVQAQQFEEQAKECESRIQEAVVDFEKLNGQLSQITQERDQLLNEQTQARTAFEQLGQESSNLQQQVASLTSQLKEVVGERDLLLGQKAEAIQDFSVLTTNLQNNERTLSQTQLQLNSIISSSRQEIDILTQQLGNLKSCPGEYELCQQQKTALTEANVGLRKDVARYLQANQELGSNMEKLVSELDKLEATNAQLNSELLSRTTQIEQLSAQINSLSEELSNQKATNDTLIDLQLSNSEQANANSAQIDQLLQEKEDLLNRNVLLLERQDCTKAPEYLQLVEELSQAREQLAEKVKDYSELEARLAQSIKESTLANEGLLPLQKQIVELDREKVALNNEIQDLKARQVELQKQIASLQQQLTEASSTARGYGEELDRLSAQLKQERSKSAVVCEDCSILQKSLDESLLLSAKSKEEIAALEKEILAKNKQIEDIGLQAGHLVEQHKFELEQCSRRIGMTEEQREQFKKEIQENCEQKWADRLDECQGDFEKFKEEAGQIFLNLQDKLNQCVMTKVQ